MSTTSLLGSGFTLAAVPVLFCLTAFAPSVGAEASPPRLEQALQQAAPKILAALTEKNAAALAKNDRLGVGVLKFLVQKGKQKPDDNAGPLNLRLAERLEVALVLALKDSRVRILHDASAVVVKQMNRRANHLTAKGRQAFFDNQYPPAWGREKELPADVFLTGRVHFDDKFRGASITVESFDRSGTLSPVCTFKARIDPRILTEAGVSYVRSRGALDVNELAAAEPAEVQKELPITFEVLYDGKAVPIKEGTVPEPQRNQRVSFRLQHRNRDNHVYGVILKVNGDNTLFPDEKPSEEQNGWKWILKPKTRVEVTGFQVTQEKIKLFEVDRVRPTDASVVRYNQHAGSFQLLVYRGKQPADKEASEDKLPAESSYIGRGFPTTKGREDSLKHLQSLLREKRKQTTASSTRGYITAGTEVKGTVEEVDFKSFGEPSSLTIRYYTPVEE
jgi:hypothetical protein